VINKVPPAVIHLRFTIRNNHMSDRASIGISRQDKRIIELLAYKVGISTRRKPYQINEMVMNTIFYYMRKHKITIEDLEALEKELN
jgi:hypothetical protein